MSHPYGSTSNPTTPIDVSAWPTMDNQQSQQQQLPTQQQQQDQPSTTHQQHQQFEQQFSPTIPVPPAPAAAYQTVQLEQFEEPQRVVPSQSRQGGYDHAPITLHPAPGAGRQSLRTSELSHSEAGLPAGSSPYASSSSGLGPHRTQQRHLHRATGPYEQARRPQSATSQVHFAPTARYGESPRSNPMSPVVPSPASTSRMASYGSAAGTPRNVSPDIATASRTNVPSNVRPSPREKPWLPRTDTHYDAETQILTLMLALPGVKKSETRVTLSTCRFNRLKQIKVSGHLSSRLPSMRPDVESEQGMIVRERTTFGPFNRVFAVPNETKREDIQASMEDGILTIKVPQGPPVEENPEEIPIL